MVRVCKLRKQRSSQSVLVQDSMGHPAHLDRTPCPLHFLADCCLAAGGTLGRAVFVGEGYLEGVLSWSS